MKSVIIVLAACWLAAVVSTSAQGKFPAPETPEDIAGKAQIDKTCTVCHDTDRIAEELRTPKGWDELLADMTNFGASGTDEEFTRIYFYLLRNFGKTNVNDDKAEDM